MIGGEISSVQLKSSSSAAYAEPWYGRVNMALGCGGWCPAIQDQNQYLQVKTNNKPFPTFQQTMDAEPS